MPDLYISKKITIFATVYEAYYQISRGKIQRDTFL